VATGTGSPLVIFNLEIKNFNIFPCEFEE